MVAVLVLVTEKLFDDVKVPSETDIDCEAVLELLMVRVGVSVSVGGGEMVWETVPEGEPDVE